jgi:predicted transcriptional regulator
LQDDLPGFTQKRLEQASGVKQPIIARMERGTTDPQLTTILKILKPLGMTLAIVPLKNHRSAHSEKRA